MKTIRDTWLIFHRSLILTLRQPTWVVFGMMLPVLYLVLFGPLLEGAVKQAGAGTNAFNWFVPGLIIQIAIFGTAFGGFGLIAELRNGVVERMRVTPMSRASMLLGRSLRDVVVLMVQAMIMILLAIPFGLVIQPGSIVAVLGLLVLIGLSVAPLSYAGGLCAQERGRVRAGGQLDRHALAAPVRDPPADGAGAGLAPVPEQHQPADPCGRRGARAVQRRLGQPGHRDRRDDQHDLRRHRGVGRVAGVHAGGRLSVALRGAPGSARSARIV